MAGFSIDISKWAEKAGWTAEQAIRATRLEVARRVIMKTPVDTGRARANWQCATGSAPSGALSNTDKSGAGTISAAGREAQQAVSAPFWIVNNLDYIQALEYGHSRQAPSGMVRVTLREFHDIVKAAVNV